MSCRGIRGATTVARNAREDILEATTELLQLMVRLNDLQVADIASALFTVTEDLDAAFPVPASLGKCVRVLLHVNTTQSASAIRHTYIHGAVHLRQSSAR